MGLSERERGRERERESERERERDELEYLDRGRWKMQMLALLRAALRKGERKKMNEREGERF